MGLFLDLFENLRKTETDVKSTKPQPRRYDFDDGFTGDRKKDCKPNKKTRDRKAPEKSKSKSKVKDDEFER